MNAAQLRLVHGESFAHYRQGLIELLLDSVQHGASIGFMADLDDSQARSYLSSVQAGSRTAACCCGWWYATRKSWPACNWPCA
ncbi:hypothetical protein PBOI14_07990 [Pseudomonas sp. Boi14]|nr:hypothetical protein PBOI14_07990 [Pseudomonas sp. Boi14]